MPSHISGAILVLALGAMASAETAIYRDTDGDITSFADRPATGRQEVDLPRVNTYSPVELTPPPPDIVSPKEPAASYRDIRITFPVDGEAIRRNGGNLRVTGRVEPALHVGHSAVLLVNGTVAVSGEARHEADGDSDNGHSPLAFTLANVSRGPHSAAIAITDRKNNILIQSAPVSFHLLRATARRP